MRRSRRGEKEKAAGVAQWCEVRGNMEKSVDEHPEKGGQCTFSE